MEARYATRKQQWLAECQVAPAIFDQVRPRLATFMTPCVETFCRQELDPHAPTSLCGLRSDLARTNVASIAERFGPDRLPLQRFIGGAPWEEAPWRQELTRQVAEHLGHADGVLGFEPSSFPTSGPASVGVARQWCGRLGQVDTGQVAVSVGDVSGKGHPWVDMRRSLPQAWTTDKVPLDNAGVPHDHRGDRSRPPVALAMVQAQGTRLPPGWSAGDDAMGRPYGCRRRLDGLGERSRLAVPGNTLRRDLETTPPEHPSRGRRPPRPWQRVEAWSASLEEGAWKRIDVRDGSQGPLGVDGVNRRVVARTPRRPQGDEALGVVRRDRDRENQQVVQVDVSRSNAEPGTALGPLARVATAEHRIAACLQRSKSEAG